MISRTLSVPSTLALRHKTRATEDPGKVTPVVVQPQCLPLWSSFHERSKQTRVHTVYIGARTPCMYTHMHICNIHTPHRVMGNGRQASCPISYLRTCQKCTSEFSVYHFRPAIHAGNTLCCNGMLHCDPNMHAAHTTTRQS